MKKVFKIFGIVLLTFIVIIIAVFIKIGSMEQPVINVHDVDLMNIDDGLYEGKYSSFPVKAIVTVLVKDNIIKEITIKKHDNGKGQKAERIVDQIVKEQSLDVDVISGATLSSNVIRKAVEQALTGKWINE